MRRLIPPFVVLGAAGVLLSPLLESVCGYSIQGGPLSLVQRDFRVCNNFNDVESNNNQTPDASFPGYQGAVMAIWKGVAEWGSGLHGDGSGDPYQPGDIGSGGANFDSTFQGQSPTVGGSDSNILSAISGCSPGVLAYTVLPTSDGWQIRFYDGCWTWDDGPDTGIGGNKDIQGTTAHEYGHALGLGHSSDPSATMLSGAPSDAVNWRSIEADDIAGVQAIYGAKSPSKTTITSISVNGMLLAITGTNFTSTGNEVWFTQRGEGDSGTPIRVTGLASDGTSITLAIPFVAGPGDVLVKNAFDSASALSNAYPFSPSPKCALLPASETVRLGSPPNPDAFKPGMTSAPIVNATWDPFIDHATFVPGSILDFLAISGISADLPSSLGTVLCLSPFIVLISPAPATPFAVPIQAECSYIGTQLYTQGGSLDVSGAIALANGLDVVIGTH